MKFASLFSPVVSFLRAAITRLSMVDGKPGLSAADIQITLNKARELADDGTNKAVKAQALANFIRNTFRARLPDPQNWDWVPNAIGWAVVLIAKRLGLIS